MPHPRWRIAYWLIARPSNLFSAWRWGLSLLAHALMRAALLAEALHQHPALLRGQRLEATVRIQDALAIGLRHCAECFLAMRGITPLFRRHLRPSRHALLDLRASFGRQLHPVLGMRGHPLLATRRELIPLRLQWREHRALAAPRKARSCHAIIYSLIDSL